MIMTPTRCAPPGGARPRRVWAVACVPLGSGRRRRPGHCPTPRPSTCPAGAGSTCSTSSWSTSRSRSRSATSPTSPSWASTSSGCRSITAAGPTAQAQDAQGAGPQGDRPGGRVRHASTAFTFRSTSTGRPGSPSPSPPEPKSLWTDPEILEVCAHHWASFAARYQGMPEQPGQLQPVQRARRQGQAGGPPPRGRARRRGDPRPRPEPADRLRRPRLGAPRRPTELIGLERGGGPARLQPDAADPLQGVVGQLGRELARADLAAQEERRQVRRPRHDRPRADQALEGFRGQGRRRDGRRVRRATTRRPTGSSCPG